MFLIKNKFFSEEDVFWSDNPEDDYDNSDDDEEDTKLVG